MKWKEESDEISNKLKDILNKQKIIDLGFKYVYY